MPAAPRLPAPRVAPLYTNGFDDWSGVLTGDRGYEQTDSRMFAGIVADPVRPGNRVARFATESRGGQRSERIMRFRDLTEGDDLWFGLSTLVEEGSYTDRGWQILTQWKNAGEGSPPLEVRLEGGRLVLGGGHGIGRRMPFQDLGAADPGAWHRYVFHIVFSSDPDEGYIEVWRDGVQVLDRYAPPGGTLYPGRTSYLKVGLYRDTGLPVPVGVLHDDLRIGEEHSAVR